MTPQEFGKYLKQLRMSLNLSIRQLALCSGVSNSYISQIENGKRGIPNPEILKKLAPHLKVSYNELMQKAGYIDDNNKNKTTDMENNNKSSFHKRLRKLRLDAGLDQVELAKILNVAKQTVSNWENGNRAPDHEMLIRIADFFNVTTDYLLGRTDYPRDLVYENEIEGHQVHIEYNKDIYPDGLTYEQVIEILKSLKKAGFSFNAKKDKEDPEKNSIHDQ